MTIRQEKTFIYGTQYWRPPTPPRGEHEFHLTQIKRDPGCLLRIPLGRQNIKLTLFQFSHRGLEITPDP